MNQITGASQTTGSTTQQGLPPTSFERLDRLDNGFSPAIPGQTRTEWLEQARTSTNPDMRAFYNELVTLAGGRTDDAALNQVIDRYQALQNAVTASEVQAAERGWLDQIGTMLSRFDPLNNLLNAVQPHLADVTRDAGLGETAWGASLQRVLDAPGSATAFNDGLRAGILAGGKDMIVSTATMVGGLVQYGADTSLAGRAGDALRGLTGPLPGVIDAAVPSRARGAASSEALAAMGGTIGDYLGAVANDPARLKTDIINAIDAQWSRLEASHAAAAAGGTQEEARWWGETVGRVSFEVAATFVPIAGQAGKVGTVARVADGAADAVRVADTVSDAARIAGRIDDAGDVVRATGGVDGAADASRLGANVDEVSAAVRTANGFVSYGSLDSLGRPTGVTARITQDMIGTGTAANRSIIPPGWSGNGRLYNEARAHLLGSQLGGSGDVPENLVTFTQNPANSPVMSGFEAQIRAAVERGEFIDFRATPVYDGNNLVPQAITLEASSSNGFNLQVSILNRGP